MTKLKTTKYPQGLYQVFDERFFATRNFMRDIVGGIATQQTAFKWTPEDIAAYSAQSAEELYALAEAKGWIKGVLS